MKVIIPIAGIGKRLRPHTHTRHKAMIPVAGKPMVDHIMDKIVPMHPTEIIFIVGYQRHQLEEHLRQTYPALRLSFVEQKEALGTAHATYMGREAFDEDVLVVFGDTIFDADLSIMQTCQDDGIIWAQYREDYQRFGIILEDGTGHMTRIVEKPKEPIGKLANIGLHWFRNTKLLQEAIEDTLRNKKPDREAYLTDSMQYMIEQGAKIKVLQAQGWFDCGTPEALLEANQTLLAQQHAIPPSRPGVRVVPPSFIHPTAIIESATIGPFASIGPQCVVRNSSVRNSILDEGAQVHEADLSDSIVGQEAYVAHKTLKAIIGDHSRIE